MLYFFFILRNITLLLHITSTFTLEDIKHIIKIAFYNTDNQYIYDCIKDLDQKISNILGYL